MDKNKIETLCYVGYGDYVRCTNCMKHMLVDIMAEVCPNCGKSGCLMDADGGDNPRYELETPNPRRILH